MKQAANAKAWAIGEKTKRGFHVRRIVWGLLLAQAEMRAGEQVRAAILLVEEKHKHRRNLWKDFKRQTRVGMAENSLESDHGRKHKN